MNMQIMPTMGGAINLTDHYWAIGGATDQVYQSKTNTMVPVANADYVAWLVGNHPTPIASEAELATVLINHGTQLPAWLMASSSFIQPAVDAYSKDQLKAYNADARWRKEQGGLTATAGFPQKTDDRAQAKITGTYTAQKEVSTVTTKWHDAKGDVHSLDSAGLYQLHVDLLTHINNCFAISADLIGQINGGAVTTLAAIDAAYAAAMTEARKNWLKPKK